MRDVITQMSRPTNGKYLHFISPGEQAQLLAEARKISDADLEAHAKRSRDRPEDEFPEIAKPVECCER